jgi:hypothetical protein
VGDNQWIICQEYKDAMMGKRPKSRFETISSVAPSSSPATIGDAPRPRATSLTFLRFFTTQGSGVILPLRDPALYSSHSVEFSTAHIDLNVVVLNALTGVRSKVLGSGVHQPEFH